LDTGLTSDFLQALRDEAQKHGDALMQGKCSDFASYRFKAGYIQGLQMAETVLHETIKQAMKIQELEDDD